MGAQDKAQAISPALYVSIEEAARIAGVSEHMMRAWANAPIDHIPFIKSGKKKLIRVAAIAGYAVGKEEP